MDKQIDRSKEGRRKDIERREDNGRMLREVGMEEKNGGNGKISLEFHDYKERKTKRKSGDEKK